MDEITGEHAGHAVRYEYQVWRSFEIKGLHNGAAILSRSSEVSDEDPDDERAWCETCGEEIDLTDLGADDSWPSFE